MLSLFRRRRLPAGARPALGPDERVLAWAGTIAAQGGGSAGSAGDSVVIVTNVGLWLPGVTGSARLGWHEIHKATWSGRVLRVVPARVKETFETYTEMVDEDTVSVTLPDPGRVPDHVRTRVTRSVAYTSHHSLVGGGVRIVARRVPGVDGLRWTVRYDPGTPPAGDAVADLVAAARAAITGGQTVAPPG